jgi:hypothetical protein
MIIVVVLLLTVLTSTLIVNRFDNGFYFLLMTKSGDKKLYFASIYLVDVLIHTLVILVIIVIVYIFGLRIPELWYLSLLFVLANPMFICAFTCLGGLVIRKKGLVITGLFSAVIGVYILINSVTSSFWLVQS